MIRSVVALLAATVAVGLALPAHSQTKITIGTGTAADFLPVYVARDKGIFAKHGIDATLVVMAVPSLVPPALISNSIQIGENTPPNILLAEEGGLDIVAIAAGSRLVATHPKIALATRAGITVTKAEDLKGRKVAVPGFNSIIDWFLRKWLINNSVAVREVSILEAPMPQMGDLLKAGQIDAAAPVEPLLSRIVAAGSATRSVDFFSQVNPDVLGTFWASTREWAEKNRATVTAYRAALAEAVAFIAANPEEAKQIQQKDLGFIDPEPLILETKLDAKDFEFFVQLGQELGVSHQKTDTSRLVFK